MADIDLLEGLTLRPVETPEETIIDAGTVLEPVKTEEPPKTEESEDVSIYKTIEEKIEKKEPLTPDEEKVLLELAKPEEKVEEKTYNIAGEVFTASQIEDKWRNEYGFGEIKLSQEGLGKALEDYVKAQNRSEFQVTTAQKAQENAAKTKELEDERLKLSLEQDEFNLSRELTSIERRVFELAPLAQNPITKLDVEESGGDPDKQFLYQQKLSAISELRGLQTREQQANEQLALTKIERFQTEHPEYKFSGDTKETIEKYLSGKRISEDDFKKCREIDEIYKTAHRLKQPLEQEYRFLKEKGNLAVKPSAQTGTKILPHQEPEKQSEVLRRLRNAQTKKPSPTLTGGVSSAEVLPAKKLSPAQQIIQQTKQLLGEQEVNGVLKEFGY